MSTLICGSIAFDSIMVFNGRFKDHILPDQVHMLNVSFLVPSLRREFGGTAGNIAYNLGLLGGHPLPMATVGRDGRPYLERLDALGIDRRHVRLLDEHYTAQAFITTDIDDNQITAFHPGAMSESAINRVPTDGGITLGVIAPDGREGMLSHAEQFAQAGIPFLFDPGQGLPMFNGEELEHFIGRARWAAFNDYEAKLLSERTGRGLDAIARGLDALIVTRGGKGSQIHREGAVIDVPVVPAERTLDPTGCGDAYRGGLLYGLERGLDLPTCARLASLMGSIKIAHAGGQNHLVSIDEIEQRFRAAFGYSWR